MLHFMKGRLPRFSALEVSLGEEEFSSEIRKKKESRAGRGKGGLRILRKKTTSDE